MSLGQMDSRFLRLALWEQTRSAGFLRYVAARGLLGFGAGMALLVPLLQSWTSSLHQWPAFSEWLLSVAEGYPRFAAVGAAIFMMNWDANERRRRRHRERLPDKPLQRMPRMRRPLNG